MYSATEYNAVSLQSNVYLDVNRFEPVGFPAVPRTCLELKQTKKKQNSTLPSPPADDPETLPPEWLYNTWYMAHNRDDTTEMQESENENYNII
jgi:hypothetical protein